MATKTSLFGSRVFNVLKQVSGLVKKAAVTLIICDGLSENQDDKVAVGTRLILTTKKAIHRR